MNKITLLFVLSAFLLLLQPSAWARAENELRFLESHGLREAANFKVTLQLGEDGSRGGSQMLLVVKTSTGYRRFDLNRSRVEWGPRFELRDYAITVSPAIPYSEIKQFGIEFHGSQGDFSQEQDDVDVIKFLVTTEHPGNYTVTIGGFAPSSYTGTGGRYLVENPVRLENDFTHWMRPQLTLNRAYCANDEDCNDGLFCNGVERCGPAQTGADARGCLAGNPPCVGRLCSESVQRCESSCTDGDGDGALSASCGGDDCDDSDPNRYPGNVEVNDAADHDEDCDVNTHGIYRGAASTQICDGPNGVVLVDERENFTRMNCVTGTVCVQQPNGTGVCMPQPEGYQAPGLAALPRGPQKAPPQPIDSKRAKNFHLLERVPVNMSEKKGTDKNKK